ncbi:hypothetical protein PIB30_056986 [Stylosanthes scabra]|uniref:Uncharacterized protein n=1 Tax=Stylosanthes scabra TaxID=79078 RepID=A0ABU6UMI7_9FABA|nr:hypothetical protein [Stylosanthes scabra]
MNQFAPELEEFRKKIVEKMTLSEENAKRVEIIRENTTILHHRTIIMTSPSFIFQAPHLHSLYLYFILKDFTILNSASIPNRASNTTVSGYRSHED